MEQFQINGLELLPIRTKQKPNWKEITKEIHFPELFKTFHDVYCINKFYESDKTQYLDPKSGSKKSMGMFQFLHQSSLVVDTFFKPDEIPEQLELLIDIEDEIDMQILNEGLIPFGYCASEELLMVSTKGENKDKIYLFTRWNDEPVRLISDNIFEFFKNYVFMIEESFLYDFKIDDLCKKWGNDFWEIR